MLKNSLRRFIELHASFNRLILATLCLTAVAACSNKKPASIRVFNAEKLLEQRNVKNEAFRDGKKSPLPASALARFSGLHYYEPNATYALRAVLKRSQKPDTITMQTTTSELRQVARIGVFEFLLGGRQYRLTAFAYIEAGSSYDIFVPFKDATNGIDTYEVGRYLNITPLEDDMAYLIDFNEAYNPYCAYNEAYSCPLVPPENVLPVSIAAGELRWR